MKLIRVRKLTVRNVPRNILRALTMIFFLIVPAQLTLAQTASPSPTASTSNVSAAGTRTGTEEFKRWFEIDQLAFSTRYQFIRNDDGRVATNSLQYQVAARGHFKFDRKGNYSIYAGLFTGRAFNSGWNDTGIGKAAYSATHNLKQLYFQARPISALEFQVGGIAPNNGENTEITGYDSDGYIMGERVTIRAPKHAYFDEISVTNGFLGDITVPNVFDRFKRLSKSNYHQFMVRKQLGRNAAFSADYTFDSGTDTLRQGLRAAIKGSKLLDSIQLESYQRIDPSPGFGFHVYGQKRLHKYFILGGGFARIDRAMLNADRFPKGDRFYLTSITNFSKEFSLTTMYIRGVAELQPNIPRTRVNIILTYNLLETLRRYKLH